MRKKFAVFPYPKEAKRQQYFQIKCNFSAGYFKKMGTICLFAHHKLADNRSFFTDDRSTIIRNVDAIPFLRLEEFVDHLSQNGEVSFCIAVGKYVCLAQINLTGIEKMFMFDFNGDEKMAYKACRPFDEYKIEFMKAFRQATENAQDESVLITLL